MLPLPPTKKKKKSKTNMIIYKLKERMYLPLNLLWKVSGNKICSYLDMVKIALTPPAPANCFRQCPNMREKKKFRIPSLTPIPLEFKVIGLIVKYILRRILLNMGTGPYCINFIFWNVLYLNISYP